MTTPLACVTRVTHRKRAPSAVIQLESVTLDKAGSVGTPRQNHAVVLRAALFVDDHRRAGSWRGGGQVRVKVRGRQVIYWADDRCGWGAVRTRVVGRGKRSETHERGWRSHVGTKWWEQLVWRNRNTVRYHTSAGHRESQFIRETGWHSWRESSPGKQNHGKARPR